MSLPDHPIFDVRPADKDEYVFHYTTIERAAAVALTCRFRLSPLRNLNDPREARWHPAIEIRQGTDAEIVGHPERMEEFYARQEQFDTQRRNIRVGCFVKDALPFSEHATAIEETRGFANPTMWAHYGGGHRGVCIAFRRGDLVTTLEDQFGIAARTSEVSYRPVCQGDVRQLR